MFAGVFGTVTKGALILGTGGLVFNQCLYNVDAGHRGIIFDRISGIRDSVMGEGTHFRVPILQKPIIMDVRTSPRSISTVTGTKDLQKVNVALRVLSRPDTKMLPKIYGTLGEDYAERVLPSITNEVLKAIVAQYNADELLTLRDRVSSEIRNSLTQRATTFHLLLDDVFIIHLAFSKDFACVIEDKQVAEQQAECVKFVVAKAEQEQRALVIRAEGDAEAAGLVSTALAAHGRGLLEIRRIETALQVADTLSHGEGNITYLPKGGNTLLNLPARS